MKIPTLAAINRELAEREYFEFFQQAWKILEPTTPLLLNWHVPYLCGILQSEVERIISGDKKSQDILINVPPRSLKSSLTTVMLNAWGWIKNSSLKFITTSYNGELSTELAQKTRRLVESDWYKENWGDRVILAPDQNVKSRFENTNLGSRKSVGVGAGVTGSGADIIVIDDPQNPQEARSEAERRNCINWFKETLYSRLNNQDIGLRILVMQRLHEEDLTGFILKNQPNKWKHICIPATENYPVYPAELKLNYKNGLFFPSRFSADVINSAKEQLGTYGFAGQMGQQPTPDGGGMIKREWFKYFSVMPRRGRRVWSWDTAVKKGQSNDFSVGELWAETKEGFYLLDRIKVKVEFPELKRIVKQCYDAKPSDIILIEDKSSGQQLLQEFKRGEFGKLPVKEFKTDKDKVLRVSLASPMIEAGKVYLPEQAEWVADFIEECIIFPNGAHDDQIDSMTQFIEYSKTHRLLSDIASSVGGLQRRESIDLF